MYSPVKSVDPGRCLTRALFKFVASGAQTKTAGTNVTCTRNSTGVFTFTFTDVNIYNAEKPIIIPFLVLSSTAGKNCHTGVPTITASSATMTVVFRVYDSSGSVADLTTNDYFGVLVDYRKSNS